MGGPSCGRGGFVVAPAADGKGASADGKSAPAEGKGASAADGKRLIAGRLPAVVAPACRYHPACADPADSIITLGVFAHDARRLSPPLGRRAFMAKPDAVARPIAAAIEQSEQW
jgi:hypothetical protein